MNTRQFLIFGSAGALGLAIAYLVAGFLTPEPSLESAKAPIAVKASQDNQVAAFVEKTIKLNPFNEKAARNDEPVSVSRKLPQFSSNAELVGTIVSERPMAYLQLGNKTKAYAVGEMIGAAEIVKIERSRVVVRVGQEMQSLEAKKSSDSTSNGRVEKQRPRKVSRDIVRAAQNDIPSLLRSARMVPRSSNGKVDGFTVSEIVPGSIIERLGIKNGDVLIEVNGISLVSPDKAAVVLRQLKEATSVEVSVERNGTPMTFEYKVD